jgi:hypothetical protein
MNLNIYALGGVRIDLIAPNALESIVASHGETIHSTVETFTQRADPRAAPVAGATGQRFTKLGANGEELDVDALDHVAVRDNVHGLIWGAADVGSKELKWAAAKKACEESVLLGFKDWRLPTVDELSTLVDRSRHEPAIDTNYFPSCKSSWYWSASPCAWSPGSDAWFVYFGYGIVHYGVQSYTAFVRAVRSRAKMSEAKESQG